MAHFIGLDFPADKDTLLTRTLKENNRALATEFLQANSSELEDVVGKNRDVTLQVPTDRVWRELAQLDMSARDTIKELIAVNSLDHRSEIKDTLYSRSRATSSKGEPYHITSLTERTGAHNIIKNPHTKKHRRVFNIDSSISLDSPLKQANDSTLAKQHLTLQLVS